MIAHPISRNFKRFFQAIIVVGIIWLIYLFLKQQFFVLEIGIYYTISYAQWLWLITLALFIPILILTLIPPQSTKDPQRNNIAGSIKLAKQCNIATPGKMSNDIMKRIRIHKGLNWLSLCLSKTKEKLGRSDISKTIIPNTYPTPEDLLAQIKSTTLMVAVSQIAKTEDFIPLNIVEARPDTTKDLQPYKNYLKDGLIKFAISVGIMLAIYYLIQNFDVFVF